MVSWGCCHKASQTGKMQQEQTLSRRSSGRQKPDIQAWAGKLLLRPLRVNPSPAPLLASACCPQSLSPLGFCVTPILTPSSRRLPLCTFSVFSFVSYEDTRFRAHLISRTISRSFTNHIWKDLISNDVALISSGDQNLGAPIQLSLLTSKSPRSLKLQGRRSPNRRRGTECCPP